MLTDIFGNDISLDTIETRDEWDKLQLAFLAHAQVTPMHLSTVLNAAPEFALGHAIKGLFYMMLGRRELVETARDAYKDARQALDDASATKRERDFVRALGFYLDGNPAQARDVVQNILNAHPRDALAMKIVHAISFILGQLAQMRHSIEEVLPTYDEGHAGYGYLMGCHAFALEETGAYAEAEKVGRKGMNYAVNDAWGLHAVAHVYDMTANTSAGLKWLTEQEGAWAHCNNFGFHVWWHKALFLLDQERIDEVFALYDAKIRKEKTDDYRDISNATSLLSRLELEGIDVGNRWEELADLSENRTADGCLIFADLHYILALVGGERDQAIRTMMSRINKDAQTANTEIARVMADPGVAAAAGLEAFGEANYELAFKNLACARSKMQLAGGSHAQRDVFERLTIDAGIRGGHFKEAKQILTERKAKRGGAEDHYAAVRFEMLTNMERPDVIPH
ncbi:tetratricopeptide repeat protein [Aliiroseovarius sp. 2305UL8-7]|uniref:tetratricopeptide repeat protein n=1 Tax=Aliiroseovarius conchicola TaxID=3121637 RepID=UPI00352740FA